ncbi:hypothetical protein SCUCBS95973_009323 [Sporothrix curviconia]|uniref:Stress activated map kinase interacting n=1 Tax=Sporothrix curviconia TaxID=1260050 RepID=A0ABP0CVM9_9PEZI
MGLVDYDSDASGSSDGEATVAPPTKATIITAAAAGGKKPFQKLVDRANPGKILVSLPSAAATATGKEEGEQDDRPAKRAKVGAGGSSSRFSGFGSFLPPPKNKNAAASAAKTTASRLESSSSFSSSSFSSSPATSRPGVNLKTSSEAVFSRRDASANDAAALPTTVPTDTTGADGPKSTSASTPSSSSSSSLKMSLPPPKAPSIPQDQKAAEDVKLVGNPLMFMPLSVSRKPGVKKKKVASGGGGGGGGGTAGTIPSPGANGTAGQSASPAPFPTPPAPPPKKKVSLFSLGADDQAEAEQAVVAAQQTIEEEEGGGGGNASAAKAAAANEYSSTYQAAAPPAGYAYDQGYYTGSSGAATATHSVTDTSSLNTIANDLHLSAKERRELFGRTGTAAASTRIAASFNMDQEYRHNEELRNADEASANGGQQQSHNPVRTLMPGKHSLRQLVNAVHTQQDALEETFAKNRQSQREAGGKYGWR